MLDPAFLTEVSAPFPHLNHATPPQTSGSGSAELGAPLWRITHRLVATLFANDCRTTAAESGLLQLL